MHKTNATGQLRPLESRMTDKAFERRTAKIAMRVGREGAINRGAIQAMLTTFFARGFFGRLKFLVLGR